MPLARTRVPPPRFTEAHEKTESISRPEPVRHVSFDEPASALPTPAPASAPSSPRRPTTPLPHFKNRLTPQSDVVPLPPAPLTMPITVDDSPLSSAETLTETPAEVKRAFSLRLTRVLRGRQFSRSPTMASTMTSSSSATVASEFGDHVNVPGKAEAVPISDVKPRNVTERGRFAFLKKSKTIDIQTSSRTFSIWPGFNCFRFHLTLLPQTR
jgi:hypothetical protein